MLSSSLVICAALMLTQVAGTPTVDAAAREALSTLPGKSGFVFTEITDDGPRELFGVNANESFAVGSSFKLYILGTLADEANASRRRLEDLMLLERIHCGPPHSEMAEWPMGSPVTLHTLALKMISISDNTATDHLLYLLGRERVERQMVAMGHSHPAVNLPLLSTAEMALLRNKKTGLPGKAYQKLNEAEKRKYLADHFAGVPNFEELDFDTAAYNLAEWYASPMDMARAMEWIYRHTLAGMPAAGLRAILAVDPKLPPNPKVWKFVGFKGGSEDQLLAGNWLMQHHNNRWYTFHVYCNSPDKPVKPEQMISAIQKILSAVERDLPQE
jgi:beta-lactamase class A